MGGTLIVWGYDFDGFWKKHIQCHSDEISVILSKMGRFDDYDFECESEN